MKSIAATGLVCLLAGGLQPPADAAQASNYSGPCDASAAVALDADHFVVANDERNTLHVYRRGQTQAVGTLDLSDFLGTDADEESDIEGAAVVGTRVYWITSHGRSASGKARPSRQRFFATDVLPGHPPTLAPVGKPYAGLLRDMEASAALAPHKLGEAARRAPEAEGGLNIEGLAAAPDGALLIGLRSPLAKQRAVVMPLQNPAEAIAGQAARLGTPIELDLGQRGIRSIERDGTGYLIVAGPPADDGSFALFRWSGRPGDAAAPLTGIDLKGLRPEALFAVPGAGGVQLLSDDGGVKVGGVECKRLPLDRQGFRSLTVKP
jgi:hypothetical protein